LEESLDNVGPSTSHNPTDLRFLLLPACKDTPHAQTANCAAGSLGTSVFDTEVYLVGASGGVYALLAAHLANVLLVRIFPVRPLLVCWLLLFAFCHNFLFSAMVINRSLHLNGHFLPHSLLSTASVL
jgi:hypothetical protein